MAVSIGQIIAAGLLVGTLAGGCGPRFGWDGQWVGNRKVERRPDWDAGTASTLGRVKLTIRDGKFKMISGGMPSEGFISISGMEATLETVAVMGRDVPPGDPPRRATLRANQDGSLTLTDPNALDPSPLLLTREAQPIP